MPVGIGFKDGKAISIRVLTEPAEALSAAGVSL
jgi:hypothetical protein